MQSIDTYISFNKRIIYGEGLFFVLKDFCSVVNVSNYWRKSDKGKYTQVETSIY